IYCDVIDTIDSIGYIEVFEKECVSLWNC
ncbi:hypothetical protein LCGC14_3068890, partial [marine sediment metagenome]